MYGVNGCGKTRLIQQVLNQISINYIYISLFDFTDINSVFNKFEIMFQNFVSGLTIEYGKIEINKFSHIYDLLIDFECITFYIVIEINPDN